LAVVASVTSSWKIVKRPGLLVHGDCEVVVKLFISELEENLALRERPFVLCCIGLENKVRLRGIQETFMVACISPT
jgi:hypothetical protein